MKYNYFKCPECASKISISKSLDNDTMVQCPHCGWKIKIVNLLPYRVSPNYKPRGDVFG